MNSHLMTKKGKNGGKCRLKGRQTVESFVQLSKDFHFHCTDRNLFPVRKKDLSIRCNLISLRFISVGIDNRRNKLSGHTS